MTNTEKSLVNNFDDSMCKGEEVSIQKDSCKIMYLRFMGITIKDIASELGISINTLKKRYPEALSYSAAQVKGLAFSRMIEFIKTGDDVVAYKASEFILNRGAKFSELSDDEMIMLQEYRNYKAKEMVENE